MSALSPAFLARDEDEQHFKALQSQIDPAKSQHFYEQFLK